MKLTMIHVKKLLPAALLLFSFSISISAQQNLRFSYEYRYKKDPSQQNYLIKNDLKVDFNGRESVCYSEAVFLRDSISMLAFDKAGNIKDQEEYGKITSLGNGAFTHIAHMNFEEGTFDLCYRFIKKVFLGENAAIEMPQWVMHDEQKEIGGFSCKKATSHYLGRDWTVWYTEEIPSPTGPWLLWGCPGIIVNAYDSDNLFIFTMLGWEYAGRFRWEELMSNYTAAGEVQHMSVKDEQAISARLYRDTGFSQQMMGIVSASIRDKNGNIVKEPDYLKYEPLIPDEYWKNK